VYNKGIFSSLPVIILPPAFSIHVSFYWLQVDQNIFQLSYYCTILHTASHSILNKRYMEFLSVYHTFWGRTSVCEWTH